MGMAFVKESVYRRALDRHPHTTECNEEVGVLCLPEKHHIHYMGGVKKL